jgi:hypothetical protein
MASEGGGGGPRKNSPQDYLFGRIIGEGEILMYFLKRQCHEMAQTILASYVALGLEKPKALVFFFSSEAPASQLAGGKFHAVKDTKNFFATFIFFQKKLQTVSDRCFTFY